MSACDEYIQNLRQELPKQCSVKDLLKIGLFSSDQSARLARRSGDTPSYFKLRSRIMYPREAVIEWLEKRKHEGKYSASTQAFESQRYNKNIQSQSRLA